MNGDQVRVLHTSDWHLGRMLENVSLVEHQRDFLSWLSREARQREVDAILVSGDVYDRAVPSVDAVRLFESGLVELVQSCPLILISGNHDSPTRLGFGSDLLAAVNVHLRSSVDRIGTPVEVTGSDGVRVLVYGIPYLEPETTRIALSAEKSHEAVLTAAMDVVRSDVTARRSGAGPNPPVIVLAHGFVRGGVPSDSERDITVGGIADAPAAVFHGSDYVALGHLHGPQGIANGDGPVIRYSGSPLAYSFSEEGHAKSVTIVDVDVDGRVAIEIVPVPVPRALRTLVGDLDDLLSNPSYQPFEECWVRAVVTDPRQPENPMERLRTRFPHAIKLSWHAHRDGQPLPQADMHVDPTTASPVDVVLGFIQHVTSLPPTPAEIALVAEAIERVRIAETSA